MTEILQPYVMRMTKVSEHVIHGYSLVDAEIQAKNAAASQGGRLLGVAPREKWDELHNQVEASRPEPKTRSKPIEIKPCMCPDCIPPSVA